MRVRKLTGLLAITAALGACAPPAPTTPPRTATRPAPPALPAGDLHYTLRYRPQGSQAVLQIDLELRGDPSGLTGLLLPSSWGFARGYHETVRNLRVLTPGVRLEPGPKPHVRVLRHRSGQRLHLRYEIHPRPPVPGAERVNRFYPVLRSAGFSFVGYAVFAVPAWPFTNKRTITLRWAGLRPDFTLINSFGENKRVQRLERSSLFVLRHAAYLGGDLRLLRRRIKGKQVVIALRGRWKFTDPQFADLVARLVRAARSFWQDHRAPYLLVSLSPIGPRCCLFSGHGLTSTVALHVSTDRGIDVRLKKLLAHELFHLWLGHRIQADDSDNRLRWFFEGFTEYYAYLLLLRARQITLSQYIQGLNDRLAEYLRSGARNLTLKQVLAGQFQRFDVYRLPYLQGHLLASNWDAAIQRATRGRSRLDYVLRRLLDQAKRGRSFTLSALSRASQAVTPGWIEKQVNRHIVGGQQLGPDPQALGPCVTLNSKASVYTFEAGFDWKASKKTRRLTGVRPGSAAWKAGLRNGQKAVGWQFRIGDPKTQARVMILRRGKRQWLRYLPRRATWTGPQYKLDQQRFQQEPATCLAPFGR